MKKRLLLISNSTNPGEAYLGWPRPYIVDFMKDDKDAPILFIPYAGVNLSPEGVTQSFDIYEQRVQSVFNELGLTIYSIHREEHPVEAVRKARAIAIGGGNTFYLVHMLHKLNLMDEIREKVLQGTPYMGWSAGSNVACPGLFTTNDMPIVEPASFLCMGLIPFQINPHYLDANPEGHGGETRQQRIEEYLTVNRKMAVAGLRETSLFRIEGDSIQLLGSRPMRLFLFGYPPEEYQPGSDISFLLRTVS